MKNQKRKKRKATQARELRRRKSLGKAMHDRAHYALYHDGTHVATFAREDDLLDFVAALRDVGNGIDGFLAWRLDAYARDALCLSTGYVIVRNESAIASFRNEDDALLFEALLAEKDERGAKRSVYGEVIDANGFCRARYNVGPKTHGRSAWVA